MAKIIFQIHGQQYDIKIIISGKTKTGESGYDEIEIRKQNEISDDDIIF